MDTVSYDNSYDSKRRFVSYWYQLREITDRKPKQVLEVGVGSGFVSNFLRSKGVMVTTVDIESDLHPDIVADVVNLPFEDNSFEVVSAYEVLEHMPYEKSLKSLLELKRVSNRWVLLSLPDATHAFRFAITIPFMGYIQKVFSLPFLFPRRMPYAKSHTWEIGIKGYSGARIQADLRQTGFSVMKTYRVFENPYHRFFILRKENT